MIAFFTARTTEEIRAGCIEIHLPLRKGKDFEGTVYDLRLGAFEPGQVCGTCGEKDLKCLGHPGYINLPEPCFNPNYGEVIASVLQSICFDCQEPRIERYPDQKLSFFDYSAKAKSMTMCSSCDKPLPRFTFRKAKDKFKDTSASPPAIIMFQQKVKSDSVELSAKDVLLVFEKIKDETLEIIGFNSHVDKIITKVSPDAKLNTYGKPTVYHLRPEAFITEALTVLPSTARPRVMVGSEKRSDDLTEAYNKIVKLAANAKKVDRLTKESEKKYAKYVERIQVEYWKITAPAPKNGKTPSIRTVKSLGDRLGGKEGRKTSNVAGKRSDHTSRTVGSSGGSAIPFGSLGYPKVFARKLTVPEAVTHWNLKWAENLLNKGKINIVVRNNRKIVVSRVCANGAPFEFQGHRGLQVGDMIHRQLMGANDEEAEYGGDSVFFNRQPTLRIESIQGMEIITVDEITHQLPLACTRPLNADFDGQRFMAES